MEYTTKKGKDEIEFEIKFTPAEWENAVENTYKKDGKKYSAPGFRKGKVPRKVIEKQHGEDVFHQESITDLFIEAYKKIIQENLDFEPMEPPIIDPQVTDTLVIKGSVGTLPEFKLGKYKGLEIEKSKISVDERHIDDYIKRMCTLRVRFVDAPEKHKLELGDLAIIDFTGSVDGVKFPGGTALNYELELGSNSFIDSFEEQLVGKTSGESLDVKVKFPEKYHEKTLAGKAAVFAVKIKSAKVRELPELNDKLASELSEFKTVDDWRASIKSRLQDQSERHAARYDEESLIKAVLSQTKIDIPEKMIKNQIEIQLQDLWYHLNQSGATMDIYLQYIGKTREEFDKDQEKMAAHIVKTRLVFDAIAKAENLEHDFKAIITFLKSVSK